MTKLEEKVIVERILEESARGIPSSKTDVRDMADKLLRKRGGDAVGKNRVDRFIKRTPELRTRRTRPYDRQRAVCEDPAVIKPWFALVQGMKEKYGIIDEDMYSVDEFGFSMGKISSQLVVTGSEKPGKAKKIQPGDREWTTLIQGVGATGKRIPPFIIFAGIVLTSRWFHDLPRDSGIQVSPTGWTNNDLALAWLEHFDSHARPVGAYRLLIVDGHESHCSVDFHTLCEEKKIITICMPPHSSHLLQPLNVACFSPLKRKYSDKISALAGGTTHHINKETFLLAFKATFEKVFTADNIRAGFRGAGLVPLDPEAVLSKLNVQLRTPTPPALPEALWEARTSSNVHELEAQSTLILDRVRRLKSSSPASITEAINHLKKCAEVMMLSAELMRDRIASLERAIEAASKRKQRKKKRLQKRGILTKEAGEDSLAQHEADQQIAHKERQGAEQLGRSRQALARCTRCRETGHNSRTCRKDT
jgi:hypothetical protein